MKSTHYARKKRQLTHLAKNLREMMDDTSRYTSKQIQNLIHKMARLMKSIHRFICISEMRRALGTTAILFGFTFGTNAVAQSFDAPVDNPFSLKSTVYHAFPVFADLDGDGDMDLLVGEDYGNMIYFKNIGSKTSPQFDKSVSNQFGIKATYNSAAPALADLDNDGDIDILIAESTGALIYQKNTGSATNPQFAAPITNTFGLDSIADYGFPTFIDLDGDGDFDLMIGEDQGLFKYYQNTGSATAPAFAKAQINPFGLDSTQGLNSPTFVDLDKDGDWDILTGESNGNLIYFKNIGTNKSPMFDAPVKNPFGLKSTELFAAPNFADVDGDGDMDLLVGQYDGIMKYFKNTTPIMGGMNLNQIAQFSLYPNPTTGLVFIQSDVKSKSIEVYNNLSQMVIEQHDNANASLSLERLAAGSYIVKVVDTHGNIGFQQLIKH